MLPTTELQRRCLGGPGCEYPRPVAQAPLESGPVDSESFRRSTEFHDEPSVVARQRLEVVVLIEATSFVADCIHDDQPASSTTGSVDNCFEGSNQQFRSQAGALERIVQCELGEKNRRYLTGCTSADS